MRGGGNFVNRVHRLTALAAKKESLPGKLGHDHTHHVTSPGMSPLTVNKYAFEVNITVAHKSCNPQSRSEPSTPRGDAPNEECDHGLRGFVFRNFPRFRVNSLNTRLPHAVSYFLDKCSLWGYVESQQNWGHCVSESEVCLRYQPFRSFLVLVLQ